VPKKKEDKKLDYKEEKKENKMAEEKAPRPSGKNDDIIKELEDYVNEKKKTGKYLDDISEFHEAET